MDRREKVVEKLVFIIVWLYMLMAVQELVEAFIQKKQGVLEQVGGGYPAAGIGRRSERVLEEEITAMVVEVIVVDLTSLPLRAINLQIGVWNDLNPKGRCLPSGATYYTVNYQTLYDGSIRPDISYENTIGGRRTVLVG